MWSQRQEVSYALQRRAKLEALRRPGRALNEDDPCDAEPILVKSALHHGRLAGQECPICASDRLMLLDYVFGDQLGQYSGRIRSPEELEEMQDSFGEFTVREVEVCPDCRWNHMTRSFVLGDGRKRRAPRREETVEDIYG
ncbi:DUF5318 domain-containing protein [Aestuariimicrobium sp. p3-SID1156]|uniref:DUF5318 domain-containing protein n=1 Tax=Aestuariimicrobium sp. p3-SID1156 TaxID=2916038 RepID=UPI00223BAEDC|nr:DUF5318 domain-containing protein [Aestuariimicrobium sp. p3-SID1156]MCT1458010.1 DUF5318 domain-containing protein [Aestuariimicrobium sp. p3-SID1156]